MTMRIPFPSALSATLALIAGTVAAVEPVRVPLEPAERPNGGGRLNLFPRHDGSSVPFPGGDGKLRYRLDKDGVLFDRNRDGVLGSDDGPVIGVGQTIQLDLALGSRQVKYPLTVDRMQAGQYASLRSSFCLIGSYHGTELVVVDGDCDGVFSTKYPDSVRSSRSFAPLGGLMELDGGLKQVEMAEDCQSLLVAPYAGDLGSLAMKGQGRIFLTHPRQMYWFSATDGKDAPPRPAIVGTWVIPHAEFALDTDSSLMTMGPASVAVTKDAETAIILAAPDRLESAVTITDQGAVEITAVALAGAGPLRWRAQVNGKKSAVAQIEVQGAGRTARLGKVEYG